MTISAAPTHLQNALTNLERLEQDVQPSSPDTQSRREKLLMSNAEKKAKERAKEVRAEKGCRPDTFYDIVCMASNHAQFIELCAEEASNHTSMRKRFHKAVEDDKRARGPWSSVEVTAWKHRPFGCSSMKRALLLYGIELKKRLETEENSAGCQMLTYDFEQINVAIEKLNENAAKSQVRHEFPYAYGLVTMQSATSSFRTEDDRRAKKSLPAMTLAEKYERFPSLQPGYPDNMHEQLLAEEIEIRRLENGNGKRGIQEPDAPYKELKQMQAVSSCTRVHSPSLETPTAVAPTANTKNAVFNRKRHDYEGDKNKKVEAGGGPPNSNDETPSSKKPRKDCIDTAVVEEAAAADELVKILSDSEDDAEVSVLGTETSASLAATDLRFAGEEPRAAVLTNALPEEVQAFANEFNRDPSDLSDFDPAEVSMFKKGFLVIDPSNRSARAPQRRDLLKKGLKPITTSAPSAKALGKRPMPKGA